MGIVVENFIGLSAPRFLGTLFSSLQNVREIRLAKCSPLPLLQARFNLTAAERGVYERALELRRRTGLCFGTLPYWSCRSFLMRFGYLTLR